MSKILILSCIGLSLLLLPVAGYSQVRIVACGVNIRCDEDGNTIRDDNPPRPDPVQAQREEEARQRAAALDDEFARRRSELNAAATLREHRAAEAERIRRMQYDAMIARQRAQGCWVPGDPPGTGKNCAQSF